MWQVQILLFALAQKIKCNTLNRQWLIFFISHYEVNIVITWLEAMTKQRERTQGVKSKHRMFIKLKAILNN